MDWFKALQIEAAGCIALKDKQDADYHRRRIFRYYSERFHTPLHLVETLPPSEVFRNYFESYYENLEEHDLEQEIASLLETDEERYAKKLAEAANEASDEEFVKKLEQAGKLPPVPDRKNTVIAETISRTQKEPSLDVGKSEPPAISLKFVDAATFERELEDDLMSGAGPTKR